jgi:ABC-type antimicrobial peptide transport system permease subunit
MVVGGVVIMNIMLAVVSERTHEIGIRKSVGARRQDILNQFLVESSMLAGMGGFIGVALAWIVAALVRNFDGGSHGRPHFGGVDRPVIIHGGRACSLEFIRRSALQTGSHRSLAGGTVE